MQRPEPRRTERDEIRDQSVVRLRGITAGSSLTPLTHLRMAVVAEFSSSDSPALRPSPSSLLAATPASIVSALSVAYPLLCCADRLLGWLTWSSADRYESCVLLILFTVLIRNLETVVKYWVPLVIAIVISLLLDQSRALGRRRSGKSPTLDEMVAKLESSGQKFRLLISPLKVLKLNGTEKIRFVLAMLIFSPLYVLITYLWVTPRSVVLFLGVLFLSWHSSAFRVARSVAWRFSIVRLLVFLVTGIDRTSAPTQLKRTKSSTGSIASKSSDSSDGREVEYTFVIYENQRHWLGIGWTANLLPEERAAWTDPSVNEVASIDNFQLPDATGTGMAWKWLDPEWLLDVAEDGSVLRANPGENDGFLYFNNVWSSPSPVASFSKYTRRRKWVRRATLVPITDQISDDAWEKFSDL